MLVHFGKLRLRLVFAVTFVVILYNEWLSYSISKLDWVPLPSSDATTSEGDDRVRLLLVADPQIQGYRYEPAGLAGYITRWDSDRYLKNSFSLALSYANPDVVLFLGDHMDEGSIASDDHFSDYKSRFFSLFRIPDNVKVISIPGDNDIGGEGADAVTDEKTQRFDDTFGKETYIRFKFVEFVKINLLTQSDNYKNIPEKKDGRFRILLTHVPLLPSRESFVQKVVSTLNPDLVISAHEHLARLMESGRESVKLRVMDSMEQKGRIWNIDCRGQNLYEIMVPTCSYRMGVPKSGYGAAIIRQSGQVEYTVLWMPERFPQLFVYIGALLFVLFLFLPLFLYHCWIRFASHLPKERLRDGKS